MISCRYYLPVFICDNTIPLVNQSRKNEHDRKAKSNYSQRSSNIFLAINTLLH